MGAASLSVLCVADYYVPGFKGGGPIRTIENLVNSTDKELSFSVFTRDRDLGATSSYSNVKINEWQAVGKAQVFYASPLTFAGLGIFRILRDARFELLYLNSFFSIGGAIIPLLLRKFLRGTLPVVIGPRGEFSVGALQLKSTKKSVYITFAKWVKLFHFVTWQASSQYEADDIRRIFPGANICIAPDLPLPYSPLDHKAHQQVGTTTRLIFLSRISPMKNLLYLLEALKYVVSGVQVSIVGPIEDRDYWRLCCAVMSELPPNVEVLYRGEVPPSEVPSIFADHDLFVFPTLGENFGHVIFESIRVGTPVLLSDQTPWQADSDQVISILPLGQSDRWAAAIDEFAQLSASELDARRANALKFAAKYLENDHSAALNVEMFRYAVKFSEV